MRIGKRAAEPDGNSGSDDKDAAKRLAQECRKALKARLSFFYCAAGPDGEPALLIGKRITAEAKALKKAAKKRKFVKGYVEGEDGQLVFYADKPDEGKLKRNLKAVFGKEVPLLKGARVEPLPDGHEGEEAEAEDAQPEAPDDAPARDWKQHAVAVRAELDEIFTQAAQLEGQLADQLAASSAAGARNLLDKSQKSLNIAIRRARKALAEARS